MGAAENLHFFTWQATPVPKTAYTPSLRLRGIIGAFEPVVEVAARRRISAGTPAQRRNQVRIETRWQGVGGSGFRPRRKFPLDLASHRNDGEDHDDDEYTVDGLKDLLDGRWNDDCNEGQEIDNWREVYVDMADGDLYNILRDRFEINWKRERVDVFIVCIW